MEERRSEMNEIGEILREKMREEARFQVMQMAKWNLGIEAFADLADEVKRWERLGGDVTEDPEVEQVLINACKTTRFGMSDLKERLVRAAEAHAKTEGMEEYEELSRWMSACAVFEYCTA